MRPSARGNGPPLLLSQRSNVDLDGQVCRVSRAQGLPSLSSYEGTVRHTRSRVTRATSPSRPVNGGNGEMCGKRQIFVSLPRWTGVWIGGTGTPLDPTGRLAAAIDTATMPAAPSFNRRKNATACTLGFPTTTHDHALRHTCPANGLRTRGVHPLRMGQN